MNISTTPRRLAQGLLVLCFTLATMVGAKAQCGDFSAVPSGPVTINMTLGGGGTVNLTNLILNGSGFFIPGGGACDMWLSNDPDPSNLAAYSNTPVTFTCADLGTSTWHIRAGGNGGVGISGNGGPGATIIDITINVIDNIPPTVMCPANVVTTTDPGFCDVFQLGIGATSADNCSASHTWSQISGPTIAPFASTPGNASGALFSVGTSVVRYTALDQSGNPATCEFSVTVTDDEPAVITCPPSINVGTDFPNCYAVYGGPDATATDNCPPSPAITNNISGASPLAGYGFLAGFNGAPNVTMITWTATAPGIPGSVNCAQTITVTDDDDPVFTYCPPNITVSASAPVACDFIGTVSQDPFASDNCSPVSFTNSYDATNTLVGKVFPLAGSPYTITWTATDAQGNNTNNCTFSITVKDMSPPVVVGPSPQSFNFNVTAGDCAKVVTFTRPVFGAVTDCGPVTMTEAYFSGPDPTVLTGAPAFSPGSMITVQFPAGVTVIRYTWSDNAVPANITTIDYTFDIDENEDPNANCTASTVTIMLDPLINAGIVDPALINNGSTDNCGIASITASPVFFDCNQLGSQSVTLTVTDNAGNTDQCMANVFVVDNTLPTIGCPASFVAPNFPANGCTATVPSLIFSEAPTPSPGTLEFWDNSFDNCGLTFDYSVNGGPFSAPTLVMVNSTFDMSAVVFTAGNNTVTVRAMDANNTAVCNFTVTIQDQTPPTVVCPSAVTVFPLIGSCQATATWVTPVPTDNCPGAISLSSTFPSGFSFPGGTTVVTYSATDVAGNIGTCTFNVLVSDVQPPVAKCKDITVNLSATPPGGGSVTITPANIDNASTDNCGYMYVSGNMTYFCNNLGTNNYTLQIEDEAGNPSSCIGVVTVKDVTAPTLTCPANMTVNANASCQGLLTGSVTATDNCSITKYEYDLDPPAPVSFALLNNGAMGNLANIAALPLGVNTITLRATDNAVPVNSSICTFTVTVQDVTPPVFAGVPANVTVACNAIPPVTNPTATDNCGTATVAYSGQTFGPGVCSFTITRTWVASDNAVPSNTASVSQVITVQDVVGPVFNAAYIPSGTVNINVSSPLSCTGNYTLNVVNITDISDACNGVSGIAYTLLPAGGMMSSGNLTLAAGTFTLPVSSFPIGSNVVTLTATDGCGNPTVKVITIVVADNQAPVFQNAYAPAPAGRCGQVYTLPNTTNNCDQLFTWTRPVAADVFDCGNETVTETISNATVQAFVNLINPFGAFPPASPSVIAQFPVGETTVTYTATQGANVSTCSFIVKILDTQAPSITCPGNQNLSISAACAAAATVPTYPPASISDNCPSNVMITQTPAPGSLVSSVVPVVAGNTFPVQLVATDNMPNNSMSAPCTFTITLVDGQSPVPVITNLPDITSNCTKDTVTAPSATDCNGTSIVTIYGTPSVPVMMVLPPLVPGGPPRYVLNPGSYVITWSYTDPQNNTSTQPQNVFITVDVTGPVAIAQPLTVNLDAMGNATVTALQLDNSSFDQDGCGPVTVSIRTGIAPNYVYVPSVNFNCSNLANMGANTVVFTATDINGNPSTFPVVVTVLDVTSPVFSGTWTAGQMDTIIQACAAVPPAAAFPQLASDQCDLVVNIALVETSTQTATGCSHYSYVIDRTWTATDDSGNTATRTQKIIVADTQAPVYAGNTPVSITANTAPNALVCNAAVSFNMADFVSDCQDSADVAITNTLISAPVGNTFVIPSGPNISAANYPIGTYVIRFTSTDACGNSATKDLTVIVADATPPTAVCINGVSASLQPSGTVVVTVNQFNNNSYDNCTSTLGLLIQRLDVVPLVAPTPTLSYDCDDADGVTQHGVKLFVTDAVGNMSMCNTYIVIQDNVAPVLTCPAPVTVDCAADKTPAALGTPTIADNCTHGAATFTDAISAGAGSICEVLTRTWKVIDQANNMGTCNQIINITDTQAPSFTTTPANLTVSCEDPLVVAPVLTATDNCSIGNEIVITFTELSTQDTIGCDKYNYTTTRTWHATDKCGNTATHTQTVVVTDTKEPSFPGLQDTITYHANDFPAVANACSVPVQLDGEDFLVECADLSEIVIDSIVFQPALPSITPIGLDVSGDYPVGTTRIIFALTDPCGNHGIDTIDIVVIDDAVPTMVCNDNIIVALGSNGEATIDPSDIDISSFDNCGIDTMVLSQATFDCAVLGTNAVTLTATDIYGNTNFCTVDVEVTLGNNTGFNLTVTGTAESYFGADNGTATAVATGGTGVFSYLWSNGDTTAVVDSLPAGTHMVSVTDVNSGCITIGTVVIPEGPKITITVGTGDGCQGQVLSIPVTVDNFINVSGFSFGLALSNGAVGAITSLSNVNPALIGLTPGVNSVFWTHPTLNPTTLPNGAVLFNVNITLGVAAVGTTSNIVASAIPALVFLQDGTNQAPMVNFNVGSASISCIINDLELKGDVFTWKAPVKPVPGVDITLAGTVAGTDVTALPDADYGFFVAAGANTVTSAAKSSLVKNNKINVGDMLGIQAHAALSVAFNNAFQWVAADINSDQRVNLVDYALVQAYVLGSSAHFPGNPTPLDWKFIPESHVFMPLPAGNPAPPALNPLNNPVPPQTIPHNNIAASFLDDDFVAVLMGDVNGDVIPTLTGGGGGTESAEVLKFRLDEQSVQAGEIVSIPFKALDFTNHQAYQMTIAFDPEVFELQDIVPGVLPGLSQGNFGTANLADGLLSTLWVGGKPTSFDDNETLFSLQFRALENVPTLSNVLHSSSDITDAMAIGETGNTLSIDFEFVAPVATGEVESKIFALYQNQPNPFTAETSISFRLPEAGRATLRVFSAEGRLVKTVIGDFAEGINAITFRKGDFGSNGVFYYELETPKHSDRKKMILID